MLLLLSLRAPKRECESPVRESSEPWNQSTDYPCPAFCFFGHSKETFLFNALPQEDRGCDLNNYCSKANSGEGRSSQKLCVGFRTRCSPGVCLQAEHLRRWCIRSLRLSREEAGRVRSDNFVVPQDSCLLVKALFRYDYDCRSHCSVQGNNTDNCGCGKVCNLRTFIQGLKDVGNFFVRGFSYACQIKSYQST